MTLVDDVTKYLCHSRTRDLDYATVPPIVRDLYQQEAEGLAKVFWTYLDTVTCERCLDLAFTCKEYDNDDS